MSLLLYVCLSGLWLGGLLYLSFLSYFFKLVCYAHVFPCILTTCRKGRNIEREGRQIGDIPRTATASIGMLTTSGVARYSLQGVAESGRALEKPAPPLWSLSPLRLGISVFSGLILR